MTPPGELTALGGADRRRSVGRPFPNIIFQEGARPARRAEGRRCVGRGRGRPGAGRQAPRGGPEAGRPRS